MAGRLPDEHIRNPVMLQRWRDVAFLHWRVDAAVVEPLLPPELSADEVDGSAWVSLVAFMIEGARPPGLPALPVVSSFPETNLRTYVRGPEGDGLWLFSADADTVVTSVGGRLFFGAPYYFSSMSMKDGRYRGRRRPLQPGASYDFAVAAGAPIPQPDGMDDLLTGRWRNYSRLAGRLVVGAVEHQPWPLHRASAADVQQTLSDAAGVGPLGPPDLVHWASGVDARLSGPRRARTLAQ